MVESLRRKLSLEELGIDPPNAKCAKVYEELALHGKQVITGSNPKRTRTIERSAIKPAQQRCQTPFGTGAPGTYPLWIEAKRNLQTPLLSKA